VYSPGTPIDSLHAILHPTIPKTTRDRAPFPQKQTRVSVAFLESPTIHLTVSEIQGDLIGIGAAVTHRPLPHHRAYGSVHGGSSGYANTPRLMTEDRASGSTHSRARRTELWTGRGTKGHDRCQPYYSPAAPRPPAGSVPPGDGAVFSTAATERPEAATGPSA
jgi:hypothetical protein